MIQRMKCIEFNMLMSLHAYIASELMLVAGEYGINGVDINVVSAYAKDLTKFTKPSIIIQRVHTGSSSIGMGNVLGSYYDELDDRYFDVTGRVYESTIQLNVVCSTQTHCTQLISALSEGVLDKTVDVDNGIVIPLNDYTIDINAPQVIGRIDICDDLDILYMATDDNKDYTGIIRTEFRTVQSRIVNDRQFINLSKGIRYTQTIKL